MANGVYVALSGAIAQQNALETTANNLANASTDGYQAARPVFREVLASAQRGSKNMRYASVDNQALDTSRGPLRTTGRPLDVALPAGAFLVVSGPAGERYTRAGSLTVGEGGFLRGPHGSTVIGEDGKPLRVQAGGTPVTVDPSGEVRQGEGVVGRLKVVGFDKPELLRHDGGGLMTAAQGAGAPALKKVSLEVGVVEEANAPVVRAMTQLVERMRDFDAFQRAIDAFRDADKKAATSVPSGT